MAIPSGRALAAEDAEAYALLERRPDNWRKQLWLKGRNMTVGQLVYSMRANGTLHDPPAAASKFALPEAQVREALSYFRRHRALIEQEAEEEKRWLIEHGYSLEPRQ